MIRDIVKYMTPDAILKNIEDEDIYRYLLYVHYPWILGEKDNPITLYRQAYLATMNMANTHYQSIYNNYIEPILMERLQILFWQKKVDSYDILYQYVRKDPILVRDILTNNVNIDVVIRSMQLNE
jgi:hypothetical protein